MTIEKEKTSYQTLDVAYPAGSAKGKYADSVELDSHYDECDGVQIFVLSDGGQPNFQVGIDDRNTFYNTLVHKDDYVSGNGVAPNARYKEITIPVVNGNKLSVNTYIPAALATDMFYQVVFRLRKRPKK